MAHTYPNKNEEQLILSPYSYSENENEEYSLKTQLIIN